MIKSGAEILISELKNCGVDTVFGYPGNSILPVYDVLYGDDKIRHILAADERGAVFMADGYARAGDKIGVCMATSGPGATNLITGIASAFMDSVPMVIVTGNVPADNLGHDSFQEVDTTGITMPVTKYNYIVKSADKLSFAVREAFALCNSGRKGPVLVDVAYNVFSETTEYVTAEVKLSAKKSPVESEIEKAAEIINASARPLIYVGGGVTASRTANDVLAFAKKLQAPVGSSFMGIGNVPSYFDNYIGIGSSVNRLAKETLKQCDLLVCLGARFSDKAADKALYGKKVKLVHLDIDGAEIGKIHLADAAVHGDLCDTLPMLTAAVAQKSDEWLSAVKNVKSRIKPRSSVAINYIKCLNAHFGNDMIVATDVGQHQLWTADNYNFDSPRKFLTSGGLGAMGYGTGAAIGAYFATGKPVLLITGDGSFNMNFNELVTVKRYGVPLVTAVMDNSSLGLIRETQEKYYGGRFIDCDIENGVDYTLLACAFGIDGYKAHNVEELEKILDGLEDGVPAVIDCVMNKNQKALR